jgi:hypothetical protein
VSFSINPLVKSEQIASHLSYQAAIQDRLARKQQGRPKGVVYPFVQIPSSLVVDLAVETAVELAGAAGVLSGAAARGAGELVVGVRELDGVGVNGAGSQSERGGQRAGDVDGLEAGDGLLNSATDDGADGILNQDRELILAADSVLVLLVLDDVDAAGTGDEARLEGSESRVRRGGRGDGEAGGHGRGDEGGELHFDG